MFLQFPKHVVVEPTLSILCLISFSWANEKIFPVSLAIRLGQ